MGRVSIQPVNWRTCAYTARYCIKKLKGKAAKERDETLEQLLETFDFESAVRDHEQRILSLMTSEERERFPGFRYVERWRPESVRMSRRPGIARDYYETHKKTIYEFDEVLIPKDNQIVSSNRRNTSTGFTIWMMPGLYLKSSEIVENSAYWRIVRSWNQLHLILILTLQI